MDVEERCIKARLAREEKREKKKKKRGGRVLALAQQKESREAVSAMIAALPAELLRMICMQSMSPADLISRSARVCRAWHWGTRGMHVLVVMSHVIPHLPASDAMLVTGASMELARTFARVRARIKARAERARTKQATAEWRGVRVLVPWPSDGVGAAHAGTVLEARNAGSCLRVQLDEGAGKMRLKCHTVLVEEVEEIID